MKVLYEKDGDLALMRTRRTAIIGCGSQGHAHALNLRDSGVDVTFGLRRGGASWHKAESAGLKVAQVEDAVRDADVIMLRVTEATREAMRACLRDIQSGEYAKQFILENRAGAPTLQSRRRLNAAHPIEVVGERLRAMMPWIAEGRLVDRSKN